MWADEEYVIPANRVMGLIERIEDHITFADLASNKVRFGKISRAYAEALRYAGKDVGVEEVYKSMLSGATTNQVQSAINGLLQIMIPPEPVQKKTKAGGRAGS